MTGPNVGGAITEAECAVREPKDGQASVSSLPLPFSMGKESRSELLLSTKATKPRKKYEQNWDWILPTISYSESESKRKMQCVQ